MPIAVDIHLSSHTLCMINEPDPFTAYSLSGHVSVSLSSTTSFFDKPRPEKVLLRSLTLIFEGQSELITNETGYSAARLYRLTRELAPAQAMLLSNDGHEDNDVPSAWNFVFDLPVPGWLPSSSIFGNDAHGAAGTSYALYAEASFTPLEGGMQPRLWSLSMLCAPFVSRTKTVHAARAEVEIVRYMSPSTSNADAVDSPATFPQSIFMIDTQHHVENRRLTNSPHIPDDVISKVQMRALLPQYVDMTSNSFMFTLRLRAVDLPLDRQQRLRITHFRMKLTQDEMYSRDPSRSYSTAFPLPSAQPSTKPLLNTHPIKALYDAGLSAVNSPEKTASRFRTSFSLLSQKHSGRHVLPNGGVTLERGVPRANEQVWTRLDICVPFEHIKEGEDTAWEQHNGRVKVLRADEASPLFSVRHELEIELAFSYDGDEEGDSSIERVSFYIPVKFARLPPIESSPAVQSTSPTTPSLVLPAYSQLFHSNGERKHNDSTPLPAYTPRESQETSHSTLSADK